MLLMPSRFEPCGLNQLYAMAYGTVPIVHAVGGLRDTVKPYNPNENSGTGWTFPRAEANPLREAISHGLHTYRNHREAFYGIQTRGMSQVRQIRLYLSFSFYLFKLLSFFFRTYLGTMLPSCMKMCW